MTSFKRIVTQQTNQNFMQLLCNKAVQFMTLIENVLTERSRSTHSETTDMCHHAAAATFTTWTPYLCYVTYCTLHLQFGRFFFPENQFLHCCLSTEKTGSDSDSSGRVKPYLILQFILVELSYICMCTYLKDDHRTNKSISSYKEGE